MIILLLLLFIRTSHSFIHTIYYTTIVYTILDKIQITEQTSHSNLLLDGISINFFYIFRALLKFLRMRN